jgi:maltose O-acetyltransferase
MNRIIKAILKPGFALCRKLMRSEMGKAVISRTRSELQLIQDINLKESLRRCGDEIHFQQPIWITHPDQVEVGTKVSFAAYVHIWGGGGVKIGDRVMIGSHTAITSVTHDPSSEMMYDTVVTKPVTIENDVWIGAHAVILPGVNIGAGAVIAAGCIVNKDVPDYAVVVGVPGRIVRFRSSPRSVKEEVSC